MNFTRRQVLKTGAAGAALALAGPARAQALKPLLLVFSDLAATVPPGDLAATLAPFVTRIQAFGLVLPDDPDTHQAIFAATEPLQGLAELIAPVRLTLPKDATPYDVALSLTDALPAYAPAAQAPRTLTCFARPGAAEVAPRDGARAAGLRTVLIAGDGAPTTTVTTSDNVTWTMGTRTLSLSGDPDTWRAQVTEAGETDDAVVLDMTLADTPPAEIPAAIEHLASLLLDIEETTGLSLVRPKDLALRWSAQDFGQAALLLLDETNDPAMAEFAALLDGMALPYTTVRESAPDADFVGIDTCYAASALAPGAFATCRMTGPATPRTGGTVFLGSAAMGFDDGGRFAAPITVDVETPATADALWTAFGATRDSLADQVVRIRLSAVGSAPARTVLATALRDLNEARRVAFLPLEKFASTLFPDIWLADRLHRIDHWRAAEPTRAEDDRDALIEDARTAWSYFSIEASGLTGLSAPTRFTSPDYSTSARDITMWDVASTINAVLSAQELGFIDSDVALARLQKIVAALPTRAVLGMTLPVATVDYAVMRTNNRDFNGCDVGRLLIALKRAAAWPELTAPIQTVVASWSLADTLTPTGPFNVVNGRIVSGEVSPCSDYALDGYALWGIGPGAPSIAPDRMERFDVRMRTLRRSRNFGPVGAEPVLTREMELGSTATNALFADALISAQADAFDQTGILHALSETPYDRDPWFSYQGILFHAPPVTIRARPIGPSATRDPAIDNAVVFSAKAAYLAAATRPTAVTRAGLEQARRTCRDSGGFVAGTYVATGVPMTGYSDVNTNGIILDAVAFMLRGRTPALAGL